MASLTDTRSAEAYRRALELLPGGVNSPVRAMRSIGRDPLFIARGEGAELIDIDGNRFLDYVCSWGPLIHGHAHPDVLAAERIAGDRTPRTEDYAAGRAPVLYLQPDHDPLAHVENAQEYQRALGDRVTVVVIPAASHAAIAEQPAFIAEELIKYAGSLWPPAGAGPAGSPP